MNPTVCPSAIPPGKSRSFVSIGYVMASTMYSVHWFIVKVKGLGLSQDSPALVCLGSKLFKSCSVVWACWSPHLPEESLVLLENGALFLFDLESCLRSDTTNAHLSGTRLPIPWDDDSGTSRDCKWIACEFSWHPRILVVLRSDAVFLVDLRSDECVVTCLAKVEMLRLYAKFENERFLTFTVVDSDRFCFALASDSLLLLCDVRKPMVPVLQWGHGLDKPCYIEVFRLSELRSNSRDDAFSWASESGFCIMLGSFWNCEFNLFCYGPTLPADKGSMASEVAELSKSVYAWELPSDLILSGRNCRCGSCLIREEALKEDLPEWIEWQQKKEIVLGFGILNKVVSSQLCRSDEFGGFTVIRLMSSGKLELQRYRASWHTVKKMKEFHRELLHFEDNFLYIPDEEEYRFPRRFKYVRLDNLSAYLNGNLGEVLVSKMKKPLDNRLEKYSFTPESHEILCEKLKACGLGRLRSSPAVSAVFNDISSPASIHEVGLRRLWSGLPIELLQLAYSNYSEFLEVLLDQKKVALEFLVVPDLPQLPPFFLRKPSCRSNKWSQKVQRSEALVGPVLPLPVLLTIHDYRYGSSYLQEGEFSLERELSLRYEEVKQVASELAVSDSSCELHDDKAVSLGDDQDDAWGASQKQKPFCLFHPAALKRNDFEDKKFDILIFKVAEKKQAETTGLELFDDLSSTQLRFDASAKNFQPSELKAFSAMKRQWSKWQDGFDSYQEFCTSSKHHK